MKRNTTTATLAGCLANLKNLMRCADPPELHEIEGLAHMLNALIERDDGLPVVHVRKVDRGRTRTPNDCVAIQHSFLPMEIPLASFRHIKNGIGSTTRWP